MTLNARDFNGYVPDSEPVDPLADLLKRVEDLEHSAMHALEQIMTKLDRLQKRADDYDQLARETAVRVTTVIDGLQRPE